MKNIFTIIKLFLLQSLFAFSLAKDFDFFYFVQQWPGSYCNTKQSCCYPTTGKPLAEFRIHGLCPSYKNGSYPSSCDSSRPYDQSKLFDVISRMQQHWPSLDCPSSSGSTFWSEEWDTHGTCCESVMNQHSYFKAAIDLKSKINLLQDLQLGRIQPDGKSYSLSSIKDAIQTTIGVSPGIECNSDADGNNQLYQIYVCVDKLGSKLIECPVFPHAQCASNINFPSF